MPDVLSDVFCGRIVSLGEVQESRSGASRSPVRDAVLYACSELSPCTGISGAGSAVCPWAYCRKLGRSFSHESQSARLATATALDGVLNL